MLLLMCNEWLGISRVRPFSHEYITTRQQLVSFGYEGQLLDACKLLKQYETNYMKAYGSSMGLTITLLGVSEISSNQGYDTADFQELGVTMITREWADNVGK